MTLQQFLDEQLPRLIDPLGADWVEAVARKFNTPPALVWQAIQAPRAVAPPAAPAVKARPADSLVPVINA